MQFVKLVVHYPLLVVGVTLSFCAAMCVTTAVAMWNAGYDGTFADSNDGKYDMGHTTAQMYRSREAAIAEAWGQRLDDDNCDGFRRRLMTDSTIGMPTKGGLTTSYTGVDVLRHQIGS
eukprot:COSAG01_NODE_50316_length_364_cov_0.784906_1_plen_117_part_10